MDTKTKITAMICLSLLIWTSSKAQHRNKKNGHGNSHVYEQQATHVHRVNKINTSNMKIDKPNRISHTYTQIINGSNKDIMPLYCPVRELDWCENWNPKTVYSNTGIVEEDCIFVTTHGDTDVVWIVSDFDVEKGFVKMFYHVPDLLVTKLEIRLKPIKNGKTKAVLIYSKTALSDKGDAIVKSFTKEDYDIMMDSWEKAMNHYLKTGEMLTGLPNF